MSNASVDYVAVGAGVGVSTGILPDFLSSSLHSFIVITQSEVWTAAISLGTVLLLLVRLCKDIPKVWSMLSKKFKRKEIVDD